MGTYRKKIKSDRILAAVLMLALLAGGVGLGIHLLHKEAFAAVVSFHVRVDWADENRDDEVDAIKVVTYDGENNQLDIFLLALGDPANWYGSHTINTRSTTWRVIALPADLFWGDNPHQQGQIDWNNENDGAVNGLAP